MCHLEEEKLELLIAECITKTPRPPSGTSRENSRPRGIRHTHSPPRTSRAARTADRAEAAEQQRNLSPGVGLAVAVAEGPVKRRGPQHNARASRRGGDVRAGHRGLTGEVLLLRPRAQGRSRAAVWPCHASVHSPDPRRGPRQVAFPPRWASPLCDFR